MSNLNVRPNVKPNGLILNGNRIIGVKPKPIEEGIPLYNPAIHRAGDVVMMQYSKKLSKVRIPELDAEGNAIPEF